MRPQGEAVCVEQHTSLQSGLRGGQSSANESDNEYGSGLTDADVHHQDEQDPEMRV